MMQESALVYLLCNLQSKTIEASTVAKSIHKSVNPGNNLSYMSILQIYPQICITAAILVYTKHFIISISDSKEPKTRTLNSIKYHNSKDCISLAKFHEHNDSKR